ncbi:MAG TPA: hypothetical protein VFZ34_27260, partial [Blastocatellia bacterium]|nr:hypothetical protein [Blastocatellia bacterium]
PEEEPVMRIVFGIVVRCLFSTKAHEGARRGIRNQKANIKRAEDIFLFLSKKRSSADPLPFAC